VGSPGSKNRRVGLSLLILWGLYGGATLAAPPGGDWPDLERPAPEQGGGEKDAAIIIGISEYTNLPRIPGAAENAREWETYFKETRKIEHERVFILTDAEATLENMRSRLGAATSAVQEGGTLWFVYIGHGFPGQDPSDPKKTVGMLVSYNAQGDTLSLNARSLPQTELFEKLSDGKQANTIVILDACFSGKDPRGDFLLTGGEQVSAAAPPPNEAATRPKPKGKKKDASTGGAPPAGTPPAGTPAGTPPAGTPPADAPPVNQPILVLTASQGDQYAGRLPVGLRPAFSYLLLGAMRGWASGGDGVVTAKEAITYTQDVLRQAKGREQTPQLFLVSEDKLSEDSFELARGSEARPRVDYSKPLQITLRLRSNPAGAEVYLNNARIGKTPSEIKLPYGESTVTLRISKDGYRPKEERLVPSEDREALITLESDNTAVVQKTAISAGLGLVGLGSAIGAAAPVFSRCSGGSPSGGALAAANVFAVTAGASFGGLWLVWQDRWQDPKLPWLGGAATLLGASGALMLSNLCVLASDIVNKGDAKIIVPIGAAEVLASAALFVPVTLRLRKDKKPDGPKAALSVSPTAGGASLSFHLTAW
jgi:hypothetical protein